MLIWLRFKCDFVVCAVPYLVRPDIEMPRLHAEEEVETVVVEYLYRVLVVDRFSICCSV